MVYQELKIGIHSWVTSAQLLLHNHQRVNFTQAQLSTNED